MSSAVHVKPIHFVEVVWGRAYSETFAEISLPTQLSDGNLAGMRRRDLHRYRIFTSTADADQIRGSAAFRILEGLMAVEIVTFDADEVPVGNDKYMFMTRLHKRALSDARSVGAVISILFPDCLVADGSFRALEALSDRAAVMIAAPRLNLQGVVTELHPLRSPTGQLTISPRDLVALGMRHPHAITTSLFWGTRGFNGYPAAIYWPIGECGMMMARYFHMHPLLVDPAALAEDVGDRMKSSIDGDMLDALLVDRDRIHVVTDSDDVLVMEMSSESIAHGMANRQEVYTVEDLAGFVRAWASPLHRFFAGHPIYFHTGDRAELARFGALEAESGRLVAAAIDIASRPQPQPSLPSPPRRGGPVRAAWRTVERTIRHAIRGKRARRDTR